MGIVAGAGGEVRYEGESGRACVLRIFETHVLHIWTTYGLENQIIVCFSNW